MANIYTKAGDKGTTGLYGGSRVGKDSLRVNCYGTVDEANSMIGLARSQCTDDKVSDYLFTIQKKLFGVGAELASDKEGIEKLTWRIFEEDVKWLESVIDECVGIIGKQSSFVVPGLNQVSATLHVSRTIVRRAERLCVSLNEKDGVTEFVIPYLNRLSDALFALARLEETREQVTREVKKNLNIKGGKIKKLDLATAKTMLGFIEEKANEISVPVVFTVVDAGGNLVMQSRMDNALLASVDISLNKAYTAASIKVATHELAEAAKPGAPLYGIQNTNSNRIVIFGGGYPIFDGDVLLGAIGVSGGSVEEDMAIAGYVLEKMC